LTLQDLVTDDDQAGVDAGRFSNDTLHS
jgi:hypothetical protein